MSQQIHWFPGHMKKAQIEIEKKVKLVDCVIELLDARIPLASRNETLYKMTQSKLRLVVLTKADKVTTAEKTEIRQCRQRTEASV